MSATPAWGKDYCMGFFDMVDIIGAYCLVLVYRETTLHKPNSVESTISQNDLLFQYQTEQGARAVARCLGESNLH